MRRRLPVGTVTFLFTDIEGSTRLLKRLGERYGDVLAEHQRILRDAAEQCEGREVDNQGDSFFFAFARAKSALAAAVIAQRALADTSGRTACRSACAWASTQASPPSARSATSDSGCTGRRGSARSATAARCCSRTRRANWSRTTVGDVTVREPRQLPAQGHRPARAVVPARHRRTGNRVPAAQRRAVQEPRPPRRRLLLAGVVAVAIAGIAVARSSSPSAVDQPTRCCRTAVVRIDPKTLKATEVAQVGDAPDLVIASGGYLWVTNNILARLRRERHQKRR